MPHPPTSYRPRSGIEGYDRALLLDAILAGKHPPGTILEFSAEDFKKNDPLSPHYAGLPTVIQLAESLGIHFPTIFQVVAVEVKNSYEVLEDLSTLMEAALLGVIALARSILEGGYPRESVRSKQARRLESKEIRRSLSYDVLFDSH